MNVGGSHLDCICNDLIDAANDRRLVCEVAQTLQIELARCFNIGVFADEVEALALLAIEFRPSLFKKRRGQQAELEVQSGCINQGVHKLEIERIGHGQRGPVLIEEERQDGRAPQEALWDLVDQNGLERNPARLELWNSEERAQVGVKVGLRDEAEFYQNTVKSSPLCFVALCER